MKTEERQEAASVPDNRKALIEQTRHEANEAIADARAAIGEARLALARGMALPELPLDLQGQLVSSATSIVAEWLHKVAGGRTIAVVVGDGKAENMIIVHGSSAVLRGMAAPLPEQLEKVAVLLAAKGS